MRILPLCFIIPFTVGFSSTPHVRSRARTHELVEASGLETIPGSFKGWKHTTGRRKEFTGRFLQPLTTLATGRRRSFVLQNREKAYPSSTQQSMGLAILSPVRIVRLTIIALVLAEILDYYGVLENPQAYKQRVTRVFEQTNIPTIKRKTQDWWNEGRQIGGLLHAETYKSPIRTITSWQPKHQFTVGATCGLLLSRLFWYLSYQFLKIIIVVYAMSELNQWVIDRSGRSVPDRLKLSPRTDTGLGKVRGTVRQAVGDPGLFAEKIPDMIDRYDNGLPASCKIGLLAGILAGVVVV